MPSSNKTAYLNLNRWSGTDKPKMTDFNDDNQKIDGGVSALNTSLSAHLAAGTLHLTTQDREKIAAVLIWDVRTYVGNGAAQRKITLGFRPKLGLIYAVGRPMFEFNVYGGTLDQFSAAVSQLGCSENVTLESDGISFTYSPHNRPDGNGLKLNEEGVTFVVITAR